MKALKNFFMFLLSFFKGVKQLVLWLLGPFLNLVDWLSKPLRKTIINHFALNYMTKVFGYGINYPRAASKIAPCIVTLAFYSIYTGHNFNWVMKLLYTILILYIYYGFFYFRRNPASYKEMQDKEQTFQFAQADMSGELSVSLTKDIDFEDYGKAYEYLNYYFENKKFYKPWRFFMHPLIFLILIFILYFLLLT